MSYLSAFSYCSWGSWGKNTEVVCHSLDLTEAEDIKKRWQEYTEELYKKDLHDPDNHEGVITHTHLEPDILECEVRWALGSITTNKASWGDGIPAISNPERWCCESAALNVPANLENSELEKDWKRSIFLSILRKGNAKEHSNYSTIALILHANKVMFKSFKLGFSSLWTKKFQMYKLDLEKAEESEIKLPTSTGS